jgi:hypothetical protein
VNCGPLIYSSMQEMSSMSLVKELQDVCGLSVGNCISLFEIYGTFRGASCKRMGGINL